MCVDSGKANTAFYDLMSKGVDGIQEEVNLLCAGPYGTAEEVAEIKALLHYILHEETSEKQYPNGIRDKGRPPGTRLEYFLTHENAKKARLTKSEVVALRFYTTLGYTFMNNPLRDEMRRKRGDACPLPVTTANAEEGTKKLRKLNAKSQRLLTRKGGGVTLWRGMRATKATQEFLKEGGTELAFMSTTTNLEVLVTSTP